MTAEAKENGSKNECSKGVIVTSLEGVPAYSGEYTIPGIQFRPLREALGVSSFGINLMQFGADNENHPEHDHREDGHEEVYLVLRGTVILQVDGMEEHTLSEGMMARVPGVRRRKLVTRSSGATVLALGGTPGHAYTTSMGS